MSKRKIENKHRLEQRDSFEDILKSRLEISNVEYVRDLLASMSSVVCILNDKNQIVFSNTAMLEKYGLDLEENILGSRPGEFFDCIYSKNLSGGCGTTDKCEFCGANAAFESAWDTDIKVTKECKIVSKKGEIVNQYDLEITAVPVLFEEKYLFVSIEDITEQKRKLLIERIFFHDIINLAGSLQGILGLIPKLGEAKREEFYEIANSLSGLVVDEIRAQEQFVKAELGELTANQRLFQIDIFLHRLADQIRFHNVAQGKHIDIIDQTGNAEINTDEILLTRVLINMLKNALEATEEGEHVAMTAKRNSDTIRFSVHNSSFIPQDNQFQIFRRFYSTKGEDRGIGTYSMKLIGERYLKGKVGFTSTEVSGTTFFIDLPVK